MAAAGFLAGMVNGLFGAGGGMVLIPLLSTFTDLEDSRLFSSSIAIILPICLVSICVTALHTGIDFRTSLPFLPGAALGGLAAGLWGRKIPVKWLHRVLGIMILWGGIRYLC